MRRKKPVTLGDTGKMLTSHKEIGQIIQTRKGNQRRRDFRGGGDKNKSCGYCGRKGKHESPEGCLAWKERRGKCRKENNFERFGNKKHELNCTN